jgi:hypothetical protein
LGSLGAPGLGSLGADGLGSLGADGLGSLGATGLALTVAMQSAIPVHPTRQDRTKSILINALDGFRGG